MNCANRCDSDECFQTCLVEHDQCIADNLLTYYERETNTLILRPIWPLEQQCRYAVVLTNRLKGEKGKPVVSPFALKHHRDQAKALSVLPKLMSKYEIKASDIQFAWVFTTGSMTKDIEPFEPVFMDTDHLPCSKKHILQYGTSGQFQRMKATLRPNLATSEMEHAPLVPWLFCGISASENSNQTYALSKRIQVLLAGFLVVPFPRQTYCKTEKALQHLNTLPTTMKFGRSTTSQAQSNMDQVKFHFGALCPRKPLTVHQVTLRKNNSARRFRRQSFAHGYGGSRLGAREHLGRHTAMGTAICSINASGARQ